MQETAQDLTRLQRLLDDSHAGAGSHLRSVITPERRLTAQQLCDLLVGMRLLTLATVTADGRPLAGPVDGIFYRGDFWFGSAPDSLRMRHIAQRPWVSASHVPGEWLGVTVHGRAQAVDVSDPSLSGFRDCCIAIYGAGWSDWGSGAVYARIDADKMFVFHLEAAEPAASS